MKGSGVLYSVFTSSEVGEIERPSVSSEQRITEMKKKIYSAKTCKMAGDGA